MIHWSEGGALFLPTWICRLKQSWRHHDKIAILIIFGSIKAMRNSEGLPQKSRCIPWVGFMTSGDLDNSIAVSGGR